MKNYILSILLIFIVACSSKSGIEKEIEKVPVDLEILRFDRIFGEASEEELPELKRNFPAFFPKQFHDSIWVNRMRDTLQQDLYKEVIKKFPSEEKFEDDLHSLFQHIKYYFPEFRIPYVVTTTEYVDYRNKVIVDDEALLISLDTYLGEDHLFYEGIPVFISKNMREDQLVSDVATSYAKGFVRKSPQRTFLARIIYFGKELYLKDVWLPQITNANKIGYTQEEYFWAESNEEEIWRNFVENEILFSTDAKLDLRFIDPAPFSKFYLEIDNESPGMIGRYIGWQIVKSYMDKNKITVQQLMMMDADEIFKKAKYKPKK